MTPMETNAFLDSIGSKYVRVHFDTGNISLFQHAEHWIPILGKRTKLIHLKEFTRKAPTPRWKPSVRCSMAPPTGRR